MYELRVKITAQKILLKIQIKNTSSQVNIFYKASTILPVEVSVTQAKRIILKKISWK